MEMFDTSRRLIREWETSGMEEHGWCCCGGQAGLHRQNPRIQLLRQKVKRLQRVAHLLAVSCVLLVSVALALLITFVLGMRGHQAPDSQPTKLSNNHSPGDAEWQQLKDVKNPSAMLTAPYGNNISGKYLQWQSKVGRAYCHGGFIYSNGSLVVPRDGVYRVFLQITYESTEDCDDLKLLNKVFYNCSSYKTDMCILSSVDTVSCSNDGGLLHEQWSKSLYTSGLFKLEANSSLRVTSSHPELIAQKEYQVFFGAELLSL